MSDDSGRLADAVQPDMANLHREENFTDLRAATIRRLTPVTADGSEDPGRPTHYIGDTTLMTQMGPIPVQFPIEADSIEDAFAKFPDGVEQAVARLNERAREMAREEASRIVVPGAGGAGGMPGGGVGPGGKIVLD